MIDWIKKLFEPKPPGVYADTTRWAPVFTCSCGFQKFLYDFPNIQNIACPECGKVHLDYKIVAGRRTREMEMGAKYHPDNLITETWEIKK